MKKSMKIKAKYIKKSKNSLKIYLKSYYDLIRTIKMFNSTFLDTFIALMKNTNTKIAYEKIKKIFIEMNDKICERYQYNINDLLNNDVHLRICETTIFNETNIILYYSRSNTRYFFIYNYVKEEFIFILNLESSFVENLDDIFNFSMKK